MNADASSGWVVALYRYFGGRDVSYLFAGGLIITVFQWAWTPGITWLDAWSPSLVAHLFGAYFLGLAASEAVSTPILGRTMAPKVVPGSMSRTELIWRLFSQGSQGPAALLEHERTIAFMHYGAAVAAASLVSVFTLSPKFVGCFGSVRGGIFGFGYGFHEPCVESQGVPWIAIVGFLLAVVAGSIYTHWKNREAREQREDLVTLASSP